MNENLKKVHETVLRGEGSEKVYDTDQLFIINYAGVAGVMAKSSEAAATKFQELDIIGKTEVQEISMSDDDEQFQKFLREHNHEEHEHIQPIHDGEVAIPLGPSKARGNKGLQN